MPITALTSDVENEFNENINKYNPIKYTKLNGTTTNIRAQPRNHSHMPD